MSKEIGKATTAGPTDDAAERRYLVCKSGAYYRPKAQGYTHDRSEAGRFTLAEAGAYSFPNGPDGPRDGITYEEDAAGSIPTCAPELPTYDPATHVLVERMTRDLFAALFVGWTPNAVCEVLGIIKPSPDPIEALAAKYGVPVKLVREIKETLA